MENFQRQALKVQSFAIEDGTFVNMYAYPDHEDLDQDYILNVGASGLRLPEKVSLKFLFADNCDAKYEQYSKYLVYGHALFQRVDEDGTELGLERNQLKELFESNRVKSPSM